MVKKPTSSSWDDDNGDDDKPHKIDPLIQSLLGHLPKPHSVWPPQERKHWIDMLEGAFKVIYKDQPAQQPGQAHGGTQHSTGPVSTPSRG